MNNQVICTTYDNGNKVYRLGDLFHRTDGPAVEYVNGSKFWYQHHQLHRTDGPAIECTNGRKEYYLYDQYFGTQQIWQQVKNQLASGWIYYYHPATQDWIKILCTSGGRLLGVSERKYYSDSGQLRRVNLLDNYYRQRLSLTTTMYFQHQDHLVWINKASLLQLQALPFPEPLELKLFSNFFLKKKDDYEQK